VVRLVVTNGSGGAAKLVERRASNRKVAKPWLDSRYSSALLCLCERHLGAKQSYLRWWSILTKDCKRDCSVLEWNDREGA